MLLQQPVQAPVMLLYASATKAIESAAPRDRSSANLTGFPDQDMGVGQWQVSERVLEAKRS